VSGATGRWLRCDRPLSQPSHRLVCFPHAGGSASFFADWGRSLSPIEVHAVKYPGRAERIAEPGPNDLRQLAGQIAAAIEPLADRPVALFGHSMGAAVALETARELDRSGVPVAHLFASGSRDADLPLPSDEPADEPADEDLDAVIRHLISLGGTDAELALDPIFQEIALPAIISDGRMFRSYAMAPGPILRCPITTIAGDADDEADRRPWSELTSGRVSQVAVPGGHFYLTTQPPFAAVSEALAERSPLTP
jgi:surfactin synthase thioesterase subunit